MQNRKKKHDINKGEQMIYYRIGWGFLALLWAALIFKMTATPSFTGDSTGGFLQSFLPFVEAETIKQLNYFIRKMAHVTAFGILALLVWKAIWPAKYAYLIAWVIASTYGAIDEWHQTFIPNRSGVLSDVLIDSLGAALALLLLYICRRIWQRGRVTKEI